MQQFLFTNLQAENRYYKYDFLIDNCTTRIQGHHMNKMRKGMKSGNIPEASGMSFRNHIHYYLDMNRMHWSKLGIDLLLGSKTRQANDQQMKPRFCPTSWKNPLT